MSTSSVLPSQRLFKLENFGHSIERPVYLYRPTHAEQVEQIFNLATENEVHIALRGAGRSYGDAALASGGIVLDLQRMNRVLDWNPETGVITVEPGVTIERLWRYIMEDGWWSPVMPGTMRPTIGGCLGANVHGKNNWKQGTMGDHVLSFDALLPNGKKVTCTPNRNKQLFHSIISGMGLLGVFTSITMQMKKIYSGNLEVNAWAEPDLRSMLHATDEGREHDYIVGWVDSTARGRGLGRGQMHSARYLEEGEDPYPAMTLNPGNQDLPDTIMGLVPKSLVWRFLKLGINNPGAWAGNSAKYLLNRTLGNHKTYLQSLVAFTFLLDYVPNWEYSYGKQGLIQYQSFLPTDTAEESFEEILRVSQMHGLPSYLGVMKRHKPDDFIFSHAVDGFSLALDFKVRRREKLAQLTDALNQIVLNGNGRFYFAKDSALTPDVVAQFLGDETIARFKQLKAQADPANILQTDLYKRCFG
ncbi:MAG: FAD-binding oxidoreductase [Anaerolineales bacterium]|nr:FAD-binding oxidoreductase [Anaerolineales bacterium]